MTVRRIDMMAEGDRERGHATRLGWNGMGLMGS